MENVTNKKARSIAIDGPGSAGKSTIAKMLAKELGYNYINTGAMYRAAALYCTQRGAEPGDKDAVAGLLDDMEVGVVFENGGQRTFLQGKDVTEEVSGDTLSKGASLVSQNKLLREKLVAYQRELSKTQNIVMDGRDIGTVVLPHADLKVFLEADVDIRAKRRHDEIVASGKEADLSAIKDALLKRDFEDTHRVESPLKLADGAFIVDTSYMTLAEVVSIIKTQFIRNID